MTRMLPASFAGQIFCLLLLSASVFFAHLGVTDVDLMEARNFVTAREITESGNWLVPTMNEEVRIAKPPLPTWLAALSRLAAGNEDNAVAMRIPSAVSATLMVLLLYGFGRRFFGDAQIGLLGASVFATSVLVVETGRTGSWDIFCHTFMLAAIWALFHGLAQERTARRSFLVAGIGLGLSFLSKGPVAFYALLLPFLISYIATFGLQPFRRHWQSIIGAVLICLFMSSLWPLYIYLQHPEITSAVAERESGAWLNRHVRSFWYYVRFPLFTGIWLVPATAALVIPYAQRVAVGEKKCYRFLLIWLVAALLLLSVIPEKKSRYLFPAMVPLAQLAGVFIAGLIARFRDGRQTRTDRMLLGSHAALLGLLAAALPIAASAFIHQRLIAEPAALISFSITTLVFWGLAAGFFLAARRQSVSALFTTSLLLAATICLLGLPLVRLALYTNPEYRTLWGVRDVAEVKDLELYGVGEIKMTMIWDAGRSVKEWKPEQDRGPLSRLPIGVLSVDHPLLTLPPEIRRGLTITVLDSYDYNKNFSRESLKPKIYLSILDRPLRE